MTQRRTFYAVTISIVVLNLVLKGLFINSGSIGGDEPFSIYIAQMDIASIVRILSEGNNPPFYEIFLHFWIEVFGISPGSVRFPSVIFSAITALYIYKIGFSFFNQRIAIISALLFTFSNYQIFFSHEARVYALVGMLTAISMFYFLSLVARDKPKPSHFVILLLTNVILIYSHYFGLFVPIVQFLFIVFSAKLRSKYWRHLMLASSVLLVSYLPNLKVVISRTIDSSTKGTWVDPPDGLYSLYNMFWNFANEPVVTVLSLMLICAAFVKFFVRPKVVATDHLHQRIASKMVILWFAFPFTLMYLVSFWIPMFHDRYVMVASVAFYLVLGIAADSFLQKGWLSWMIPSTVALLFIVTCQPNMGFKRNMADVVQKIKELKTDQTIVYFCPEWYDLNIAYYYNIEHFQDFSADDIKSKMYRHFADEMIFPINHQSSIDSGLISKADRVLFFDAGAVGAYPDNGIYQRLNEREFQLHKKDEFGKFFVLFEFRGLIEY